MDRYVITQDYPLENPTKCCVCKRWFESTELKIYPSKE